MRFFYKSPFFYLPVIALLLYAAAGLFVPGLLDMTANGDETLYTLINYTGFFSVFAETFIVIPLFFVFIQQVHGFYGNLSVVLRQSSVSRLTVRHSFMSLLFCLGFVLYLYFLLFIRSACAGELAGFCSYGRFFLCSAVLQTLVLYSYAELSFLLRLLLKNDALAFFLPIFRLYMNTQRSLCSRPRPFIFRSCCTFTPARRTICRGLRRLFWQPAPLLSSPSSRQFFWKDTTG